MVLLVFVVVIGFVALKFVVVVVDDTGFATVVLEVVGVVVVGLAVTVATGGVVVGVGLG